MKISNLSAIQLAIATCSFLIVNQGFRYSLIDENGRKFYLKAVKEVLTELENGSRNEYANIAYDMLRSVYQEAEKATEEIETLH